MMLKDSCILLLSGGLDSVTLLHYLVKREKYRQVYAISFLYGQKHLKEIQCAEWQMNVLEMKGHFVVDLSFLSVLLQGSSTLITGGGDVPRLDEIREEDKVQPSTYVPNRNMIFLSIASAWAETLHIQDVYYSAQAHDEYGYWDCTEPFVTNINAVLSLNRKHKIRVNAPFISFSKKEILQIGFSLGVDYSHTWSCYRGEENACGTCPTCIERLKAFEAIGRNDPLPYLNGK